ncbi:MAG TPA: Hsp70 family protein [Longimicrobium sp.]|nr:Hsp70 family protein [Longimicrobium sp.]
MGTRVGIDLGTTNSAVAVLDEHGRPVVLPNRFGARTTPSVVCFRGGEVVVGEEARELQAGGEPDVAAFFKRQVGVPGWVFYGGGRDHTAVELSALVLRLLRDDAERALGEPVGQAVITVPAYFRNPQREATIAAGKLAGLEVLQVVNEPTAAAVAYGLRGADEARTLLVYDLGGGTFDVTLLRLDREELRVLHSDGDHELGGKDWDDRVVEYLANRFQEEWGADPLDDRESIADLLVGAEEVKKRLSSTHGASLTLVHGGRRGRYTMDRATLEALTADLMERSMALTLRVLGDQGLTPAQVDGVLLVGGSTRMPMVHDFVRRTFGREPLGGVNPDEAVALGAAVVAAEHADADAVPRFSLAGPTRRVDVTNHSLGMIALNEDRSAYVNTLILPKNTPIPRADTRPYQHRNRRGGANTLEVFVTQGESEHPADVTYLGKYVLSGLPHADGGVAVVDVEYRYDVSGTVQVAARDRATGLALEVAVEPLPGDVPARFLRPPEVPAPPPHVTAYLAFDLSGSMRGAPLDEAKKAARSFLANTDLANCSVGIIAFADREEVKAKATQNARTLERAISGLTVGEVGGGNATDPFRTVLKLMARDRGPRFVITLADGAWDDQPEAVRRARACHEAGIESIAIGFGGADRAFLARIASSDEASFFTTLGGLSETFAGIAQVITETQGAPAAAAGGRPAPAWPRR